MIEIVMGWVCIGVESWFGLRLYSRSRGFGINMRDEEVSKNSKHRALIVSFGFK